MLLGAGFGPLAQVAIWERFKAPPGGSGSSGGAGSAGAAGSAGGAQAPGQGPFGPGKSVLLIGDSHTNSYEYGRELKRLITKTGAKVAVDAKDGASSLPFVSRVADDIKQHKPDTIVISLGTNFRDSSARGAEIQVERLVKAIRDTGYKGEIVWVGPPPGRDDAKDGGKAFKAFEEKMQNATKKSGVKYVSSGPYVDPSGVDRSGIHYKDGPSDAWAKGVFEKIASGV